MFDQTTVLHETDQQPFDINLGLFPRRYISGLFTLTTLGHCYTHSLARFLAKGSHLSRVQGLSPFRPPAQAARQNRGTGSIRNPNTVVSKRFKFRAVSAAYIVVDGHGQHHGRLH